MDMEEAALLQLAMGMEPTKDMGGQVVAIVALAAPVDMEGIQAVHQVDMVDKAEKVVKVAMEVAKAVMEEEAPATGEVVVVDMEAMAVEADMDLAEMMVDTAVVPLSNEEVVEADMTEAFPHNIWSVATKSFLPTTFS